MGDYDRETLQAGQHRAGVQRNEPPLPDGSQSIRRQIRFV